MIAIGTFTRSSSFRVGALFTLLSAGAIGFIVYIWSLANNQTFVREAQAVIEADRLALQSVFAIVGEQKFADWLDQRAAQSDGRSLYALRDAGGTLLAGNLSQWPAVPGPSPAPQLLELNLAGIAPPPGGSSQGTGEKRKVLASILSLSPERDLFIGRDVDDLYYAQRIGNRFSWVFIALLLVISVLSFLVAHYVVQRINRMSNTADRIMQTGDLGERLEIDSNWDDLSKLALVFNRMLGTIEDSMNNIKTVSDNIAHDLRTPLTRLRNTLSDFPDSPGRDKALHEADNLLAMFHGLLRIGQIETQLQKQGFRQVNLEGLVEDVIELYAPLAEEQGITLITRISPVTFVGDSDLLFQAVANLIDNSLKYGNADTQVVITLEQLPGKIRLSVEDSGQGVEPEQFHHLTRRFYRGDKSRSSTGNGLGLSMVAAIVQLHQGQIWFVDKPLLTPSGFGTTILFPLPSATKAAT